MKRLLFLLSTFVNINAFAGDIMHATPWSVSVTSTPRPLVAYLNEQTPNAFHANAHQEITDRKGSFTFFNEYGNAGTAKVVITDKDTDSHVGDILLAQQDIDKGYPSGFDIKKECSIIDDRKVKSYVCYKVIPNQSFEGRSSRDNYTNLHHMTLVGYKIETGNGSWWGAKMYGGVNISVILEDN